MSPTPKPSPAPYLAKHENDAVRSFQNTVPTRCQPTTMDQTTPTDDFIMDTNNSSIVSKRSVERLYSAPGEPEYFRYFVCKLKRRSPLINRGYWLRMQAVERTVARFLAEATGKSRVVVNLGCGHDPLPFIFLGKHREACADAVFVDVDYPALMRNKCSIIEKNEPLRELLPNFARTESDFGVLATSDSYMAVGCDLRNIDLLRLILREKLNIEEASVAILFVAEVSVAYMEHDASQDVLEWAASYPDVRFCLLEQHLPDGDDTPFARTMLAHFKKLRTPLYAIGTLDAMRKRFEDAGWPAGGIDLRTLWELWSNPTLFSAEQRRSLDAIEPFDEWEEFALFASHYFLMVAEKRSDKQYSSESPRTSQSSRANGNAAPSMPQSGQIDTLYARELPGNQPSRRFGALIPPIQQDSSTDTVAFHAGVGTRERLSTSDTYSRTETAPTLDGPPLRSGIMCHTITRLSGSSDCLLVGGRTSPDKAQAECWARRDGQWSRCQSLPEGRYRHCAVALTLASGDPAVLVLGGKNSSGQVLHDWLLWTSGEGWRALDLIDGDAPCARFGAAMINDTPDSMSGVLMGGMTSAGKVLNDFWTWTLQPDLSVVCQNVTPRTTAVLKQSGGILGRFGAQLVRSEQGILLVGGVAEGRMLTRLNELLNLRTLRSVTIEGARPLLVGCSVQDVDGGLLLLGGGATCFSFGTCWSSSCFLSWSPEQTGGMAWRQVDNKGTRASQKPQPGLPLPLDAPGTPNPSHQASNGTTPSMPTPKPIPRVTLSDAAAFDAHLAAGTPIIITSLDIGPCTTKWTPTHLERTLGANLPVTVHTSHTPKLDFAAKNFTYTTQPLSTFIHAVSTGAPTYLRTLSATAPTTTPADLSTDFPALAADFNLPPPLAHARQHAHSTPLRLSGDVQMWLHYDVMANLLCQIRGSKDVILFPPRDVTNLSFAAGGSSSSMDAFDPSAAQARLLARTTPWRATLGVGEVLLIPACWPHSTVSKGVKGEEEGLNVAANVFFRSLEGGAYAAGKDVYGNRDVAAYEQGRRDVRRMVERFGGVGPEVAGFYLMRLGMEMWEEGWKAGGGGEGSGAGGER